MRMITALFLAAFALPTFGATAEQWKSRSIYQIVTDRFALGNNTYPACNTTAKAYCGGNWQGIINNIDYIYNMGFDAIWISPITNQVSTTPEGDPYHGYWTGDLDALNDNFGGDSDLKDLVSSLHLREMYLMLDVNVNHMGANSTPANVSYLQPFSYMDQDFHSQCAITDETNQQQVEDCWISYGSGNFSLPDLNSENQTVVDMLNMWASTTVNQYNVDGLRINAAKNVPKSFWPAFAANASVFTLGEVVSNSSDYAAPYTQVLDSVLDYPLYYVATQAFSSPTGDLGALASAMSASQQKYNTGSFSSGVFLENHDVPRLPSMVDDDSLIKNALAWSFGGDGMPVVYYGQEQGFSGGGDPDNREALWLNGLDPMGKFVSTITHLNAARRAARMYDPGFHNATTKLASDSPSSLVLVKPPMLTLLSNGGNASTTSWNVSGTVTGYGADEELVDLLSCATTTSGHDGGVNVQNSDGEPMVFLPRMALKDSLTCGPAAANQRVAESGVRKERRANWEMTMVVVGVSALLHVFL